MHARSVRAFDFDAILVPYNYSMMENPQYAADFEDLYALCQEKGVAMQTIKAIALRRWRPEDPERHFSWYKPISDPEALQRAVDFVLARPGLFLNTTSDATLLDQVFRAAESDTALPDPAELAADSRAMGVEPLFIRDVSDDVLIKEA
jgi:hypothetical protein